ncbi:MAG TPA: DICT sensory domain-containing protein [Ktedonobacterales bacterium]
MDDDALISSSPQDSKDGERHVLRTLRQRLSDALIRISQLDQPQSGIVTATAQSGGLEHTRPLSLPRDALAGTALSQAISLMSTRVPFWDASYVRAAAQALQTLGTRPANGGCFTVDVPTMVAASHAIEERVIKEHLDCELYAGFQRLSLLRPQLRRYVSVLDNARYVYVFGIDDIPPGMPVFRHQRLIRFIITPQSGAGLLWFWFLLVNHPNFSTVLLTRQVSGELFQRQSRARAYQGFWSFDPAVVHEIMRVLREAGRILYYEPH